MTRPVHVLAGAGGSFYGSVSVHLVPRLSSVLSATWFSFLDVIVAGHQILL